ncbi:MAG TPA: VanW family protein [Romboutsia timonensis]|uniref:VanW family protein n=1 Tax=Romboutsia timonensis TaxID=1776391 RepID=A0A921N0N2_9FIRM|nr:VanW family protein [Romboutsia timonensis]
MYKYKFVNKFTLILSLFIMLILTTGISTKKDDFSGKIYKNIYIEELNIGKMKINEAKDVVNEKYLLKPIYIKYEDKIWCINPEDIELSYNINEAIKNAYLYTRNDNKLENIKRKCSLELNKEYNIKLNVTYNESKLSEQLSYIQRDINKQVKQATIEISDNGQMIATKSKEGLEVDIISLKEQIYDMIKNKDIKNINLPVKIIKPTITTKQVKSINTILGQFSTSFNEYSSRGTNIYIAAKSTSDILIMPGDTFSYNKSTGARTWSNGYKTAKVIVNGKYVNGEGGGVCQVSTTIYNAALISGLEIQEVHNHTYPSHYVPKGRDAAVSYGYIDLKFKNNFAHPIYIKNIVSNGAITSKIYGCSQDREKLYIRTQESHEKDKIIVKTYRVFLGEENNKIREELVSENKYKIK